MSNYNHTPATWKFRSGDTDNYFEVLGPYKSQKTICLLPKKCFVSETEAESNARLIAAAPDLLNALKEVLGMCQYPYKDMETYKQAQRVIMDVTQCSIEQTIPVLYNIKNIDGIIKTFKSDSELVYYTRIVAIENEDEDISITCINEAKEYLNNYCSNLELTISHH